MSMRSGLLNLYLKKKRKYSHQPKKSKINKFFVSVEKFLNRTFLSFCHFYPLKMQSYKIYPNSTETAQIFPKTVVVFQKNR